METGWEAFYFMVFIIGTILAIIVLIIIGLLLRKRIYDWVDRLESWKMDIMGRNVASQLSKIKSLNLSGETQEKFEAWKERWEHIITRELPNIEEHLFDAEEAADRFRINKAKSILNEGEETLQGIEKSIENILQELDELLESEETSRKEAEELSPLIKGLRKLLSQSRYQYGKAEKYFDDALDKMEAQLSAYYELVESGDYIEAGKQITELKSEIQIMEKTIDAFPTIYKKYKHDMPSQLDNMLSGLKDMRTEGYRIEHLGFEKEIHTYQERLSEMLLQLDNGDMTDSEQTIVDMEERLQEMYEILETEAHARNYLETHIPKYEHSLDELIGTFDETKLEVEQIKKAYYVENNDMERFLSVGKTIYKLKEQLEKLSFEMEKKDKSHSELREQVEDGFKKIEDLRIKHEEFKKIIQNLRKDELEAREKLAEMRHQLSYLNRRLKKSNIPGVPSYIWSSFETALNKNEQVIKTLEKYPLDMVNVQQALTEAKQSLEQTAVQVELMLDQAYLTEQVIQYANRYRSHNPILAAKLHEAERLFRAYEYELSLEHAAKAVEEVEPGALKHIEENQTVMNK
ncbi:septation ring formation regulator EzrA [Oceanobacillus saliphilus]|uniref:septation ring formation regulator EzrA n=1 Tax=Oceanobacillus saliphilus TaxID=2925834 RepID=UPI00201D7908|nr:septation ring formation regulator EzrA [Oceanobacillus saliphilus]